MQIAGGNDQLPRRIAEGLDVRLGQPVRTIGWSGPGVTVETETETVERRPPRRRRPRAADDRARLGPAAPAGEGRRARVAALRHRRRRRDPVRRDRHVRDAIRTGVFTDRLPNWFLDVSADQPGAPIVVVSILSGERQPRGLDDGGGARRVRPDDGDGDGQPGDAHVRHGRQLDGRSVVAVHRPRADRRPARHAAAADQGAARRHRLLRRRAHGRPDRTGRAWRERSSPRHRVVGEILELGVAAWASRPSARPGSGRPSRASRTRRCCAARAGSWTTSTRRGTPGTPRSSARRSRTRASSGSTPSAALEHPGVIGVLTGADVAAMSNPFPVGVENPPPVLRRRRTRSRATRASRSPSSSRATATPPRTPPS